MFGFVGDSHLVTFMLQSLIVERTSGRGIRDLMVLAFDIMLTIFLGCWNVYEG